MNSAKSHILLSRMEAVRHETRHHLDLVRRQIEGRTERIAIAKKANNRSHKRAGSFWPRSDQMEFQSHLKHLEFGRHGEIETLIRKSNRQNRASLHCR